MAVDLGRVQGGSMFHTAAASGTSVSVSSLQPQSLTPFVGDAVAFPNGDVRQITGVSGSTVTLGEVMWSNKGDPGVSDATLSNTDGNSTVNGFTQEATKGIAQAKNYYNLGAFDTYVPNSDGTGTVTRKTGYGSLYESEKRQTENGFTVFVFEKKDIGGNRIVINKNILYEASLTFTKEHYYYEKINAQPYFVFIVNSDSENFYFQYELAEEYQYTEQVIENQPIRPANKEEELYWHGEWRKGLNLINCQTNNAGVNDWFLTVENGRDIATFNNVNPYTFTCSNNHIVVTAYNESGYRWLSRFIKLKKNTTYTILLTGSSRMSMSVFGANSNTVGTIGTGISGTTNSGSGFSSYTFNSGNYNYHYISFYGGGAGKDFYIMLNEGAHPYPNEPFNGEIIHENRVPLYMTTENTSPAQTIGGDWESLGSFTTSTNQTLYAWRKL